MENEILNQFISAAEHLNVKGVVVWQNGKKLAEHHWEPDISRDQYSVSKSITNLAVGAAISEGMFSLEDSVSDLFSDDAQIQPAEDYKRLKVRHLLTMSTGHDCAALLGEERRMVNKKDWVKYVLNLPVTREPGSRFLYTNAGAYLLAALIQQRTGMPLEEYLMPRVFEPLGITPVPEWAKDRMGRTFGASGLMIRVNELAKIGQLYLQHGCWEGRQLIPAWYIKESMTKQIETDATETQEDRLFGYGYLVWMGRYDTVRFDGWLGQFCILSEQKNAVIAVNSNNLDSDAILSCIWEKIYPQL